MKKAISTIVAVAIISSMSVNAAHAGSRGGIDPIWIPVAIFSTLAAAVAVSQPTVIHEQRVIHEQEPRRVVVYEEPPRHRHMHYYEHDRGYDMARYRERDYRYR